MKEEQPYLYFGGPGVEFEDALVGNREGLERLKKAIDEAIESGDSSVSIGEFIGVRCMPTDALNELSKPKNTTGSKVGFWLIGICFVLTVWLVWLSNTP